MLASRLRFTLLMACLLATVGGVVLYHFGRPVWVPIYTKIMGRKTVAEVMAEIGPKHRAHWQSLFGAQGLVYPSQSDLVFLVSKEDRWLEVWIDGNPPVFLQSIPVTAASGTSGPKLREGDRQVPEGIYGIEGLNPNSAFHLSMKLDYPNAFDRQWGATDGRQRLGGDIFLHGKSSSIGCVAIGDEAIEQLFSLVADSGRERVKVVIAPRDFRDDAVSQIGGSAMEVALYREVRTTFSRYRR